MSLLKKSDKIFIAGHKGMVGAAIKKVLEKKGYKKIITADKSILDLRNKKCVDEWFIEKKPDITIIAAAKVGGIFANNSYPFDFLIDNLKIQNNVIESSWRNNTRRLLFLGSSCIYPKFALQPIKEDYLLTNSLEPTNQWYAIAKISGIKLCEALHKQHGFDSISLMPTNLYGPRDNYHKENSHVIPGLIRRFYNAKENGEKKVICWGSGKPMREFLHVEDLGNACCYALENWDPSLINAPVDNNGEKLLYLNVGTGIDQSIKSVANMIAKLLDYKGKIEWDLSKPDGTPKKVLDITHLKKLGWEPKISLEEGLERTILDFKKELNENRLRTV